MATGGLYGSSGTGALVAQPGSESSGLYGNSTSFGGTYFEWFIFQTSATQPATPTGGSWNFLTNTNTPPTGWTDSPPASPTNKIWVSIALVNSKSTEALDWSVPGLFAYSGGLPILSGTGTPSSGVGQADQLYIQTDVSPQSIWFNEAGTWTRLTGSALYATAAQGVKADTAIQTITSTDGSIGVVPTGTSVDLSVVVAGSTTNVLAEVRNTTGATLAKGTAVYISGATGQLPTVSKALANSDATSAQTLGLITSDLANNTNGYVTVIGLITNMNTSAYIDGEQLYLSPTIAGALTGTKPYAPQHLVYVAVVEHAHPTQGKLFVKVQNGYELDELHNVSAQTPVTGQTIVYNSATGLWEQNTVSLTAGINGTLAIANGGTGATSASAALTSLGAYPASNPSGYGTGTVTSVSATAGTGISITGSPITSSGTLTITNTAPDQTVSIGSGTGISVTGTYPNFTVTNTSTSSGGTVTSVSGAGTVNGLTLTGTVTSTGSLTLGGTLSGIANSALTNSSVTINGSSVSLGGSTTVTATATNALTIGTGLSGTSYNGSSAVTVAIDSTVATLSDTQTLTNKRVTPRVVSITDAATITPTGDSADQYVVTALAQTATIAAPSGTPTDGQKLVIRIEDNGTGRALTWTTSSGAYRAVGVTLPTTTVASKVVYIGCIYNSQDTFWDVIAVAQMA